LALNCAGFGLKSLNLVGNYDDNNYTNINNLLILRAIGENAHQTRGRLTAADMGRSHSNNSFLLQQQTIRVTVENSFATSLHR